ncbi:MAG: hypothetical protein ILP10_01475 [Lachnospiraceae bacterium]|nr:hypothetical protein [Lachnospiraceae bacterium]
MAMDAISSVKQAEADAAAGIKNAGIKREEMLEKATQDVANMKRDVLSKADATAKQSLEAAERDAAKLVADAEAEADREIADMKAKADSKRKEAEKLIAAKLISV